jgi:hypothetical protein
MQVKLVSKAVAEKSSAWVEGKYYYSAEIPWGTTVEVVQHPNYPECYKSGSGWCIPKALAEPTLDELFELHCKVLEKGGTQYLTALSLFPSGTLSIYGIHEGYTEPLWATVTRVEAKVAMGKYLEDTELNKLEQALKSAQEAVEEATAQLNKYKEQ